MTTRCFDTYYPGGSENLEIFLESVMSGRYLFFAVKVTKFIMNMNPHFPKSLLCLIL